MKKVVYEEEPSTIQKLVIDTMNQQAMNDRQFGSAFNLSHATVINWRKHGKMPKTDRLEEMLSQYEPSQWQFQFALDCLAVKNPLVWGPNGVVWTL